MNPLFNPPGWRSPLVVCLFLVGLAWQAITPAKANPKIRDAFFSFYPQTTGTPLDTLPSRRGHCGVCHFNFKNGGDPWNPYGQALRNVGGLGGQTGASNAIWTVRFLDPEGDGFTAQTELADLSYANTPTFPGLSASNVDLTTDIPLGEIQAFLTPIVIADTTPPLVSLLSPNGGEILVANQPASIRWTASDASGIAAIHLFESLDNGATYHPLAQGLPNSGTYTYHPANRPTTTARIRVEAVDGAVNRAQDASNGPFAVTSPAGGRVPTTLRDFDMPGTQPFEGGPSLAAPENCAQCHGHYDASVEPYVHWQGSMMAHASRDPLFEANMVIANQDAPDSGDLCLRCHFPRGWLQGRSVPTDGSRMIASDRTGVSCDLCHRLVDPVYRPGVSPNVDEQILAALSFRGTNYGNGMIVTDPSSIQRGPFADAAAPHAFTASPFHRSAALCGTCHDVSNPVFTRDANGSYAPNALNSPAANTSAHSLGPVERTYSEWYYSAYNTPAGVAAPEFAGTKADGRVSTCQDCHMQDVQGYGANPTLNPGVPRREDLPKHDLTGGSTWLPGLLASLYPEEVDAAALQAGIGRAQTMLSLAANLGVSASQGRLHVAVTNQCGHKLPTGYPEGRRIWLNVQFFDAYGNLLAESAAYDSDTGILSRDAQAKIYEVHPGIGADLAAAVGLPPGPSLHFVLNNQIFEDNRIPPRGFSNEVYASFGGAPAGHHYEDGQYWDETEYAMPPGTVQARVALYYQSTSKEFVEFLRDANVTNSKGQEMYALWANHGKCPPTLMAEKTWVLAYQLKGVGVTAQGHFRIEFYSRPGLTYSIEYRDSLSGGTWRPFAAQGTLQATDPISAFEDDFTINTSGSPSPTGARFYRILYGATNP